MIPAIGLAMGALSTVSSLVDQAASSVSSAVNPQPTAVQSFTPSPASPKKASLPSMPQLNPRPDNSEIRQARARRPARRARARAASPARLVVQPPRQRLEQMRQQINRKLRQREE